MSLNAVSDPLNPCECFPPDLFCLLSRSLGLLVAVAAMTAYTTKTVSIDALQDCLDDLAPLLHACVLDGASVNFLLPFSVDEARQFWQSQEADIQAGRTILCVATSPAAALASSSGSKTILGCVLVKLAQQPNQVHRADIGKMLVSPEARRKWVYKRSRDRVWLIEALSPQRYRKSVARCS